jgi:hypothetical protein
MTRRLDDDLWRNERRRAYRDRPLSPQRTSALGWLLVELAHFVGEHPVLAVAAYSAIMIYAGYVLRGLA